MCKTTSCCICNSNFPKNKMLMPAQCLRNNGDKSHGICQSCWWSKFAIEHNSHKCPGCKLGVPLN